MKSPNVLIDANFRSIFLSRSPHLAFLVLVCFRLSATNSTQHWASECWIGWVEGGANPYIACRISMSPVCWSQCDPLHVTGMFRVPAEHNLAPCSMKNRWETRVTQSRVPD
eukprot:1858690-Rhodomonas_salina.1